MYILLLYHKLTLSLQFSGSELEADKDIRDFPLESMTLSILFVLRVVSLSLSVCFQI